MKYFLLNYHYSQEPWEQILSFQCQQMTWCLEDEACRLHSPLLFSGSDADGGAREPPRLYLSGILPTAWLPQLYLSQALYQREITLFITSSIPKRGHSVYHKLNIKERQLFYHIWCLWRTRYQRHHSSLSQALYQRDTTLSITNSIQKTDHSPIMKCLYKLLIHESQLFL